ncbi:hypothetical protein L7F22_061429 [Adiantum nelumboides]|nr:hypothetical protein [Adiantum nelumboides]
MPRQLRIPALTPLTTKLWLTLYKLSHFSLVSASHKGRSPNCKHNQLVSPNVTIHWHGVSQILTAWADGPAYMTQCPIQTGQSFISQFQILQQRGTLFWHTHISWLHATLHGAIVIRPHVLAKALESGRDYTIPEALTINGYPGALNKCSQNATQMFRVNKGETYMLRLINALLDFQLYFAIANHKLTVVEADAECTQPLERDVVVLAPGQTLDVLLTANQPEGNYYVATAVFNPNTNPHVLYPHNTTTTILTYNSSLPSDISFAQLKLPSLPSYNESHFVANFTKSLERITTSINNQTFDLPQISLLEQAYYNHIKGVYKTDFPDQPPYGVFNYAGINETDVPTSMKGTKVKVLEFGKIVQTVFQNTHSLHGQNFYIVGEDFGNYDASLHPSSFNLRNPPFRNTVSIPAAAWAAIRFVTDNPGVWFMHCHFDLHTEWGMNTAFIVKNGKGKNERLPPPPPNRPPC